MVASGERIAVAQGAPGETIQSVFGALAERWSARLRVAGVIAEGHGLADRRCRAGYLRHIAGGERFSIFADRGSGSRACHVDQDGAAAAAEAVRRDIIAGCDLVLLSKFGRLEAAGKGLWRAFAAASQARIPLLTSLSPAAAKAWENFAGTGFITLPADASAIDSWLNSVRTHLKGDHGRHAP
jgi:hypothetical protein